MKKKNFLTGKEKELMELSEKYETALIAGHTIYLDAEDLADLADWYAMHFLYEKAFHVIETGLKIHPNNSALLVEQAYLYLDTQNRQKAKEIVTSIVEENAEATILKANIFMGEGREEEAEKLLDGLTEKDDLGNIIDIIYMYMNMDQPLKAKKWLEQGLSIYGEDESLLPIAADCHITFHELDQAIECYNKLIDINPYSASYWTGLAQCYMMQGEFNKAIDACEYALISDEEYGRAYVVRSQAYGELGNNERSNEDLRKAIELKVLPDYFLYAQLGIDKIGQSMWEEAKPFLQKAEKSIAANDQAEDALLLSIYINLAICHHKLNRDEEALNYCQKLTDHFPDDINGFMIEARIHFDCNNYDLGLKAWAKALHVAPYPITWNEIGINSMEIGLLEHAQKAFEQVKELDPDFEGINEELATIYLLRKDEENFIKYNALSTHPIQGEKLKEIQDALKLEDEKMVAQLLKDFFNSFT